MKRIIMHWTAGGHTANASDRAHYHIIIEGDGRVVRGDHAISDNESTATHYAAHTRSLNSGSIGIAVAAMRGARERPFSYGPSPITLAQVDALASEAASLCRIYSIPVTRETVLTHAEVQPTLGVAQSGKWDITWLPHLDAPGDPVAVGDWLRDRVRRELTPAPKPAPAKTQPGWLAALMAALTRIFGGKA